MSDLLLQVMRKTLIARLFSSFFGHFRVGNSEVWSEEMSFKTDCSNVTKRTFAVMGDMGTVIPAGFLVAKQIREDHQVTPLSAVVHVGDISYAGTGSKDEISVNLTSWRMITTTLSLLSF